MKTSCQLIGQWPYQSSRKSLVLITVIWVAFLLQAIPQIIAMVVHRDDWAVLFEAFSSFVIDLAFIIKYYNTIQKSDLVKELFDSMRHDCSGLSHNSEIASMQDHANLGYLLSASYAGIGYVLVMIFVTEPVLPRIINLFTETNDTISPKFSLPLEYIIIDKEKHYPVMFTISNIFVMNIIVTVISCDITLITFVTHACGLFAVVGSRVKNSPVDASIKRGIIKPLSNSMDIPYRHLVSCIRGHRRALEFAERLEYAYTVSFGILVGLNLPVISVTGLQIITQSNTVEQLLKYLSFTLSVVMHIFFLCFLSQQLTDTSSQIQECITDVKWYHISTKAQKLLILMTMNSQASCKLTAAKIMELSIENFGMMMKTCGSYFTMLLSMQ
ncbi:odorant receptor 22c-like [Cotesia glomerata]|uniref:odorant receptor 22c-like n=1 Tax=Cotesia glomerata TaxID=32391 RepID=UPI001D01F6CD|nr:odorant receptor 22c-like [Cotesia glomerata]